MACSSCGGRRVVSGGRSASPSTASGSKVLGFDFIPPGGGVPVRYLMKIEAQRAQRRAGGGTIQQVVESA